MFSAFFSRFLPVRTARLQPANRKPRNVLFLASIQDWQVFAASSLAMGLNPVAVHT